MTEALGSTWDERMQPCVHEAGHAVVAHRLGGRVAFVMVAPNSSGESRTTITEPEREVVGRSAGRLAEQRYWHLTGGAPAECHPMYGDTDDRARAWEAAQLAYPDDVGAATALVQQSCVTAAEMVDADWDLIRAVARAVCESPERRLLGSVFLSMMEP
jgi:hypothetical protein